MAPVISPFQFDGPLNAGDSAFVTCFVPQGDRPLKIKWYHNSHHITHHSKGIATSPFGSQASILNINFVEPHHRGEYACVATNAAGKTRFVSTLNVNGTSKSFSFDIIGFFDDCFSIVGLNVKLYQVLIVTAFRWHVLT